MQPEFSMLMRRRALRLASAIFLIAGAGACDDGQGVATAAQQPLATEGPRSVSALGRLEPQHGIITVSASSVPEAISGAILVELAVEVGDDVTTGQLLAVTDTAAVHQARVAETATELELARREARAASSSADAICVRAGVAAREAERLRRLHEQDLASEEATDRATGAAEAGAADCTAARSAARVAESAVAVMEARLARHREELRRSHIRSPADARVLAVNTRPGELIGAEGILELGRVDDMYAIAEVYETDVTRLRPGQKATVTSPALPDALTGRIERIRPIVRKQDAIGTDPAARKDARIVEVEVALDEPGPASALTHLQVEVLFEP